MTNLTSSINLTDSGIDASLYKTTTKEEEYNRLTSPLIDKVKEAAVLPPALAQIVALYAIKPILVDWYTALTRINFTGRIPPLPLRGLFSDELDWPDQLCPEALWKDGTPLTKGEAYTLMLVPQGLGTVNEMTRLFANAFSQNIKLIYGQASLEKYGDTPSPRTRWVTLSKDVLDSNKSYEYQSNLFLGRFLWHAPTLRDKLATILLQKIAEGESDSPGSQNSSVPKITYLEEVDQNQRLTLKLDSKGITVGKADSSVGLEICSYVSATKIPHIYGQSLLKS